MSSLEKELHLNKLPSRPPMPTGQQPGSKARMGPGRKRDFSPVPWNQYFETMKHIAIEHAEGADSFRIYQIGSSGPVLLLLHGGGHSALSWAVFSLMITSRIHCRIVAVDLRGHGDTDVIDDENLSAEAMSRDIGNIVQSLYGTNPPPIMLVGHSMGGAIAVHIAASQLLPSLLALCVIDVVEGTAMDALNSMQTFLRSRPKSFTSVENAIEWSVKSGQIRNLESAKVSMAGQIKECKGTYFISPSVSSMSIAEPLEEEEEEEDEQGQVEATQQEEPQPSEKKQISVETTDCVYTWRIDLAKTEKYWDGWFRGLSNLFLGCPVPKLLLLAGVDRLDRELTIGQMQGKFQMQVLPQCGHAVHEDDPDKVAEAIATFLIRNKFTEAKGDI